LLKNHETRGKKSKNKKKHDDQELKRQITTKRRFFVEVIRWKIDPKYTGRRRRRRGYHVYCIF
jgi:hypothetical protein